MISTFADAASANAYIAGLNETYNLWHDLDSWHVLTGDDIPQNVSNLMPHQVRNRFTGAERNAITDKAYNGAGDVMMQQILLELSTATDGILTNDQRFINAVNYFEFCGIIDAQRKAEIMA